MSTALNPKRLRYVTSNFRDLQGLHQVALGVMILFWIPVKLHKTWNIWIFGLLLLVLLELCKWRIGIYYENKFGYVDVVPRSPFWKQRLGMVKALFWPLAILLYVAVALSMNLRLCGLPLLMGVFSLGYFVEDDKRWYYLPFAALFFVLSALNGDFSWEHLTPVAWLLVWLTPFAIIVTGILDHRLLVRSLAAAGSNGTD
jgi:hypothetical protein